MRFVDSFDQWRGLCNRLGDDEAATAPVKPPSKRSPTRPPTPGSPPSRAAVPDPTSELTETRAARPRDPWFSRSLRVDSSNYLRVVSWV